MKFYLSIVGIFFCSIFFADLASAQTNSQSTNSGKIGVIYTSAFGDAKAGITKYVAAVSMLEKEFQPINDEFQTMITKYQNLQNEIKTLQEQAQSNKIPVSQATVQGKIDEYGKLERELKFKDEDIKARLESRQKIVLGPVLLDIRNSLGEFSKQKGFSLLLDAAKLEEAGIILTAPDEKIDVTKDFIAFYNARPAGTPAVK